MIGSKIDIKAYKAKGESKKRLKDFSIEETILTHYESISNNAKKIAKEYFEAAFYNDNSYKDFILEEAIQEYLFEVKANVPFPGPALGEEKFTFIDLFAGIGGFRLAMQDLNGKCIFSSEWDNSARHTYRANFGDIPFGDITKSETKSFIPKEFDILCAGFPCQPFSRAGVSARNFLGLEHGFNHPTQGNLFFEILQIAIKHKPKALFLENVKNLRSHDGGNTFRTIERMIHEIGYSFFSTVVNAQSEVPQRRERTYMVCFKDDSIKFKFPKFEGVPKKLKTILEKNVSEEYTISDRLWEGHKRRTKNNIERGVGFTAFLADLEKPSSTIVARYGKDGKECLIPQDGKNPRKLTPRECARLQGFPKEYILPPSNAAAYKQFGNSVAVPVIKKIASEIIQSLQ